MTPRTTPLDLQAVRDDLRPSPESLTAAEHTSVQGQTGESGEPRFGGYVTRSGEDDLAVVRDDLAYELRRHDLASRSPHDGRLCDPVALAAAQRVRCGRIAVLREQERRMVECG